MIPLSSCPPWRRLDRSGPAGDHDGLAVVTPRAGTRSILERWPKSKLYEDIKTLEGKEVGEVYILTGGFPCQPVSSAGKRRGAADDRWLWPDMLRIIKETRPTWIIGENVAGLVQMGLDGCLSDLESAGYAARPFIIPACAVNAPHRRDRVWIVAHAEGDNVEGRVCEPQHSIFTTRTDPFLEAWETSSLFLPEAVLCRSDDGIPDRVDRTKALGNAIVPQVAAEIMSAIKAVEA
jgi:DNA (cytosine-5)-methyltransferase 1